MDEKTKYIINFASKINFTTFEEVMSKSARKPQTNTRRMLIALFFSYGMSIIDLSELFDFVGSYVRKNIHAHKSQFKEDGIYRDRYIRVRNEYERILRKWKK